MHRSALAVALVLLPLAACASAAAPAPPATPTLHYGAGAAAELRPAAVSADAVPGALPDLLALALEQSPRIHAARARAEAAAEGPAIAGSLPDPKVMVGWYETAVETRVGPQRWSVRLEQPIPWPGRLAQAAAVEEVAAQRAVVAYERVVRDVLVDVVQTAHEIAYLDEAVTVTREIDALLQRYEAAAASEDALLDESFRAGAQRARVANDLSALADARDAEAERLRALLGAAPGTPVPTPLVPAVPRLDVPRDRLLELAGHHAHELREAGLALDVARERTALAEAERYPDLSVGLTRIATDRLDGSLGMDPDGNGDDPFIVTIGATLPIWQARDAATVRRARALERAAAHDRAAALNGVRERLARTYLRAADAERLARLYADLLVPRAAVAARSAEDLLAAGKGSVGGALETIATLHRFRLAGARARADQGIAIAQLERIVGRPFTDGGAR